MSAKGGGNMLKYLKKGEIRRKRLDVAGEKEADSSSLPEPRAMQKIPNCASLKFPR